MRNRFILPLLTSLFVLVSYTSSAFHVDITLTSNDGCKFHIVGEVEVSWTGGFESFSGTVTASGDGPCPNGTWTFGMTVVPDPNGENERLTGYKFSGNCPLIDILLSEPETLNELIRLFKEAG